MSAIDMAIDEWIRRIRNEYRENPGLRLTGPRPCASGAWNRARAMRS